jgi:hypothetical protein
MPRNSSNTFSLWAFSPSRKNLRAVRILVDEESYLRYRGKRLKIRKDQRVYFLENGKMKYLKREIFNLTDPKDRLFFNSPNVFDLRKQNISLQPVPEWNRGRYCVQKLGSSKN